MSNLSFAGNYPLDGRLMGAALSALRGDATGQPLMRERHVGRLAAAAQSEPAEVLLTCVVLVSTAVAEYVRLCGAFGAVQLEQALSAGRVNLLDVDQQAAAVFCGTAAVYGGCDVYDPEPVLNPDCTIDCWAHMWEPAWRFAAGVMTLLAMARGLSLGSSCQELESAVLALRNDNAWVPRTGPLSVERMMPRASASKHEPGGVSAAAS